MESRQFDAHLDTELRVEVGEGSSKRKTLGLRTMARPTLRAGAGRRERLRLAVEEVVEMQETAASCTRGRSRPGRCRGA